MAPSLRARRLALATLFFFPGAGMASWVTRTPDIRDMLAASTAEMGLVLLGLSLGSMIGILSSGALVARLGARPVIAVGAAGAVLSMPVIGVGAATDSSFAVATGLFLFGAGMGGGEVAMNVEGSDVERVTSRSFLPALHGCFSLGTVVGAVVSITATAAAFPVVWHLGIVGAFTLLAVVLSVPALPPETGRAYGVEAATVREGRRALWKDSRLLLIGVIILGMALAEGTANDWLPLVMVDGHGFDPALGSTIYAVFAAAMAIGRFSGGWFVERFGRAAVLGVSSVFAAVGLTLVIFVDSQVVAAASVLLWGLGASLSFPVAIGAAGDSGPDSAARVSLAATVGYLAFLVGPPALGFVGEEYGLRAALLIPLVFVVIAALLAPLIGGRRGAAVLVEEV